MRNSTLSLTLTKNLVGEQARRMRLVVARFVMRVDYGSRCEQLGTAGDLIPGRVVVHLQAESGADARALYERLADEHVKLVCPEQPTVIDGRLATPPSATDEDLTGMLPVDDGADGGGRPRNSPRSPRESVCLLRAPDQFEGLAHSRLRTDGSPYDFPSWASMSDGETGTGQDTGAGSSSSSQGAEGETDAGA
jgi:hypothetical protein